MIINQRKESARGQHRHGSCGVGVHETITRSQVSELKITMADLWNNARLENRLHQICTKYASYRTGKPIDGEENMLAAFIHGCEKFASAVHPLGISNCEDPIFEGAQGLLLDKDNKEYFPHLTHSNTGMKNIRGLCDQAGITEIEPYYVSRTYLTRHGAGPLPGEDPKMSFPDDTNLEHKFQGTLRFAPLDHGAMITRCHNDSHASNTRIIMTHCDQEQNTWPCDFESYGPTRDDVVPYQRAGSSGMSVEQIRRALGAESSHTVRARRVP
jgi:adenylosuccinate synthase